MTVTSKTCYSERTSALIRLGSQLGRGGEATVYDLDGQPDMVVKIKHIPLAGDDLQKLQTMLANPPVDPTYKQHKHHSIAWPVDVVYERDGAKNIPIGFVMPKMTASVTLAELMNPRQRERIAANFNYRLLLNIGKNLAIVVKNIHAKGHVIGDMNTLNVMVSTEIATATMVTVIDCDSFQIQPTSGPAFRCNVGKPEFTAPEIQNRRYSQFDRTQQHDMFAFAVIMYQLLMQNAHPFQGVPKRKDFDVDLVHVYNIANGIFPHLDNPDMLRFPHSPSMMTLPAVVRELFLRAFLPGYVRPSATDWRDALDACVDHHEPCMHNPNHVQVRGSPCVICEWEMINHKRPRVGPPVRELRESDVPSKTAAIPPPGRPPVPQQTFLTLAAIETYASAVADRLPPPYPYQRLALVGDDAFVVGGDHRVRGYAVDTAVAITLPEQFADCIAVSGGEQCLYALRADGRVIGWSRQSGQIIDVPTNVPLLRAIAAGARHLLGLTDGGDVVSWGSGPSVPTGISSVVQIAAGVTHSVAMSTSTVWLWGGTVAQDGPVLARIDVAPYMVAAGGDSTVIVTTDGVLHYIAQGVLRELPLSIELSLVVRISICKTTVFVHLANHKLLSADMLRARRFEYHRIRDPLAAQMIDATLSPSAVLIQGATRVGFIRSSNLGAMAVASKQVTYQTAVQGVASQSGMRVSSLVHFEQQRRRNRPLIAAGESFSAVVSAGTVRSTMGTTPPRWTQVDTLQAGRAFLVGIDASDSIVLATSQSALAARVPFELQKQTMAVAAGAEHIVAVSMSGTVCAWGTNTNGQTTVPAGMRDAVVVAAGSAHSLALLQNGSVVAWGDNRYGQCTIPGVMKDVVAIWAGFNVSAAVSVDGSLWMWGELEPHSALVFAGLRHVVSVSLGRYFGSVLFADGSVVGWGANDRGQATPPMVKSPVVAIASGAAHTVAQLFDGTIVVWGDPTQATAVFA